MPIALVAIISASAVLHASWNLAAHSQRRNDRFFLRLCLAGAAIGLLPALLSETSSAPMPGEVWMLLLATGACQAAYYFGLSMGYRHGEFSVVYPVARALPVLILAVVDMARGRPPNLAGWAGLVLVFTGCVLAPQVSLKSFSLKRYWSQATVWIAVVALAMVGYTTLDKAAAELLPSGPLSAIRYGAWENVIAAPWLWLVVRFAERRSNPGSVDSPISGVDNADWRWPVAAAVFMVAAYWLVLWAYQLSPQASYIAALRQLSLVIGAVAGVVLFKEPGGALRIAAGAIIVLGVFVIAFAG